MQVATSYVKASSKKHILSFEYQTARVVVAFSSLRIYFHSLGTDPVLEAGVIQDGTTGHT